MVNQTIKTEGYTTGEKPRRGFFNFISWSSIFAGLVIALIVQFLLTLLGIAIGMGAIQPLSEQNPMEGIGTGAIIWWIVTVLVSLFAGGWVAGKWAGAVSTYSKVFHGLLTWGIYTILSFYLLTTAIGGIISGVGSIVGRTLTVAGQGAGELAPMIGSELEERGVTQETIEKEVQALFKESGIAQRTTTTGTQIDETDPETAQAFMQYKETKSKEDKEALINVIVAKTDLSRAEAEAEVNQLEARVEEITVQAEERARLAADQATRGISRAALIAFIALIVGAIAAAFGAGIAKREYDETSRTVGV